MRRKLPKDAFTYYASLGVGRSYQAVADFYKVDKRTVARHARDDDWAGKVDEMEKEARAGLEKKLAVSLEEMNERHLKILRVVQGKALEALRAMPLRTALDAVRALDFSVRHERLILGEPSERAAVTIEDTIKREYARWMTTPQDGVAAIAADGTSGEEHGDGT